MSLIFYDLSLKKITVAIPWGIDFAKSFLNCGKKLKIRITEFGSHGLSGFRVAANNLVVWDKNPPS